MDTLHSIFSNITVKTHSISKLMSAKVKHTAPEIRKDVVHLFDTLSEYTKETSMIAREKTGMRSDLEAWAACQAEMASIGSPALRDECFDKFRKSYLKRPNGGFYDSVEQKYLGKADGSLYESIDQKHLSDAVNNYDCLVSKYFKQGGCYNLSIAVDDKAYAHMMNHFEEIEQRLSAM